MQKKLVLWAVAIAVALGSMAGLAVRTVRAEITPLPLVISAVQITGGEGVTSQDFIELYNPNPFPVDLNGYRLVKRSANGATDSSIKSFSTATLIPAYSFYLWANSGWTNIAVDPDTTTSATLANDNGVGLRFGALDSGVLVDSLAWGTTSNGFVPSGLGNPGPGESIVRHDLFEYFGYQLQLSSPRNSSMQALPDAPPAQVNDSACEVNPLELNLNGGQKAAVTLDFKNTGNTVWVKDTYSVKQLSAGGSISLQLGEDSINPLGNFVLNIEVSAPEQSGEYTYQWQMQKNEVLFGSSCLLALNVTTVEPEPEPEPVLTTVRITEFLPNPAGEDSGKEVIELYNFGSKAVNLKGWVLDDIQAWPASSNSYVFGDVTIGEGKYMDVTIPTGRFGLNNTGGDVVTLFNPSGAIISSVSYEGTAPEGKTYSLVDGKWHWAPPSLGSANPALPDDSDDNEPPADDDSDDHPEIDYTGLVISEIYAAPAPAQAEFLEIFNGGSVSIDLKDIRLSIGSRVMALPNVVLPAGNYYAVQGKELKLPLADSGKLVQLVDLDGDVIDEVSYPKAKKGESYSLFEDGFLWTTRITPGQENQFENETDLAEVSVKKPTVGAAKVKAATSTQKQESKSSLAPMMAEGMENFTELPKSGETKPKSKPFNVLVIGLASLGAGILAIYKYGFGGF